MTHLIDSIEDLRLVYVAIRSLIHDEVNWRLQLVQRNPYEQWRWNASASVAQHASEAMERIGFAIAQMLDDESDCPVCLDERQVAADFATVKGFLRKEVSIRVRTAWKLKVNAEKTSVEMLESIKVWFYAAVDPSEMIQVPEQMTLQMTFL